MRSARSRATRDQTSASGAPVVPRPARRARATRAPAGRCRTWSAESPVGSPPAAARAAIARRAASWLGHASAPASTAAPGDVPGLEFGGHQRHGGQQVGGRAVMRGGAVPQRGPGRGRSVGRHQRGDRQDRAADERRRRQPPPRHAPGATATDERMAYAPPDSRGRATVRGRRGASARACAGRHARDEHERRRQRGPAQHAALCSSVRRCDLASDQFVEQRAGGRRRTRPPGATPGARRGCRRPGRAGRSRRPRGRRRAAGAGGSRPAARWRPAR